MIRATGPNPPLKWHGGKAYLASRIIALMPPHVHYVEPFAGGLSVLLAKNPNDISEVANDLNGELANFWEVLQNDSTFEAFQRHIQATPFSEDEWEWSGVKFPPDSCTTRAIKFFVRCRQSLAGRMKHFAPLSRSRTRTGMNEQASAWLTTVEGLPAVHERLKRVVILSRDALDVIREQDGPQTLFYLDPPYLHETRATTSDYAHEMTRQQHSDLLELLTTIKGKFLLSGYRSELYDSVAERCDWSRHDFEISNHASGAKEKRRMTECVWCNF